MVASQARQAQMPANRLQFDRYVLDLDRGCLVLDGNEIELRPKTFAVLQHLVQNCRRLVSKEELFASVWSNLVVTDDALVQSIGELRRALGDDGPRLIRTVPRRGYRLECEVLPAASTPADPVPASVDPPSPGPASPAHAQTQPRKLARGPRIAILASLALAVLIAAATLLLPDKAGRSTGRKPDATEKLSIAVLPFLNQGDDPSREYFADGLAQDIIDALGRFPELTVLSWNAVAPYKGQSASPGDIARRLSVQYQVEGSVLRTGERVRVIAQLVNSSGRVLWSARFDEALPELLALEGRITAEIAGALAIRVTQIEQQRVLAMPTDQLEAYDYVLRARPALQRPTRANNAEARALLRRAVKADPGLSAAYAALAETYQVAVVMGWAESPAEFLRQAEKMAHKALSIDHSQVRAHVTLGRIHIFYDRYEEARTELERALAINSNHAGARAGRGNVLMWQGQTDAAIEDLERAQHIDPELNAMDRNALSLAYYLKKRYGHAIDQAERNVRETAAASFSHVVLAVAYAQQGRGDDAMRAARDLLRTDPTFDPQTFGNKLFNPTDLEHLRDGLRKAGLLKEGAAGPPAG